MKKDEILVVCLSGRGDKDVYSVAKYLGKDISEELEVHIQEIKKDYISDGMNEKEAEEKAVSQMGKAEDIGRQLNRIHKPHLDWKLLILIVILMGFNLLISVLKESTKNDNYLWSTIIYMLIGIIISIGIYFFDYRKLKKHKENHLYFIKDLMLELIIV